MSQQTNVSFSHRYAMNVAVVAASGIREFFHVEGFEFTSSALDHRTVTQDGREQFLTSLKNCVLKNPLVAQRLGRLRYKLRTSRIQAV